MIPSDDRSKRGWVTGDPISKVDRENVRDLIYAGFSRRMVANRLGLHKDLVGEVFDELSPPKLPRISEETSARIMTMVSEGASLTDIANDLCCSESSVRKYAKSLGIHPRTLTAKYLREKKDEGVDR